MFIVDKDKCQGCGACLNVCPVGAISFIEGIAHIDKGKCINCGRCESVCPTGAIIPDKSVSGGQVPPFSSFLNSFAPFRFFRGRGGGFGKRRGGRGRGGGRRRGGF